MAQLPSYASKKDRKNDNSKQAPSTYRKSIEGATKIKLAPPKAKYIEHILSATRTGEAGVGEVFRVLQSRIRDTTWTITFKALIVAHLMIREGEPNVTLAYLASSPRQYLSVDEYAEVQTQGRNIRHYSTYLMYRAKSYQKPKLDYVISGRDRLRKLTVDKGLLRETESVQEQIAALLKCDLVTEEPENDITLCALRLLIQDLLALFPVMNEGVINVLEHFFEMSHPDAERGLTIYKRFAVQTDLVVRYLAVAKRFTSSTRLEIPKLEHAKLSLASSLEEYLNEPEFDTNRREFLAERAEKRSGKPSSSAGNNHSSSIPASKAAQSTSAGTTAAAPTYKRPAPDLIDFFDSIEPPQQAPQAVANASAYSGYGQANSFQPQATGYQQPIQIAQLASVPGMNPFGQLQAQPTGAGFGGYGPQAYGDQMPYALQQPQQQYPAQTGYGHQQSQSVSSQQTNPFRQSASQMGSPVLADGGSNPFGLSMTSAPQQMYAQQPMMSQPTGTNPFTMSQQQPPQPQMSPQHDMNGFAQQNHNAQQLMPQATGYNPFQQAQPAQSMLPQQTGANPWAQQAQPQFAQQSQPQPIMPQATGTNPFARAAPSSPSKQGQSEDSGAFGALVSQATGSTNPFKNGAFVNQQTGQGWQTSQQATMGGLEQLPTMQVFPRPGQQQQQQQPWY